MSTGQLSIKGEELALNAVFRTNPVYLGLATSVIDDATTLAQISEVTDSAYTRKLVTFSAPIQESGKTTIKNSDAIDFAPWNANQSTQGGKITYAFTTNAQTGTTGDVLTWFALDTLSQIEPVALQPARVLQNSLVISLD